MKELSYIVFAYQLAVFCSALQELQVFYRDFCLLDQVR